MAHQPVDLADRFEHISDRWSPKVVARLNDYEIKLVRVNGEFVWHSHEDKEGSTRSPRRPVESRR